MDKYIFELIDIVQKGNKDKVINLFSTSEIAKKSNVSVQAVYKLEKNALKKLKKLL